MRPTVILRHCPDYDSARIAACVREALATFELQPAGRTLVKPNIVASGPEFPHAYTRPEFTEGVLRALRERGQFIRELAVGERCGITMPTRYAYRHAGYYRMAKRVGNVRLHHFDECPQIEIRLRHPDRLRSEIFVPEPVARADFFVNCPKFKAHPWTTVTFGLKNYIGLQDDRHRLLDHDFALNRKVLDLQYVVQPQLIAVDAIVAGEGRMLTPLPFDLKLVILGTNPVAVDAVCARIIGLDPMEIEHIRLAHEHGFGPIDASEIDVAGDVTLEAARERAAGFRSGLIRVEEYFAGTNIRAYGGAPPGEETDYCWGGCPGAMQEAIEVLRLMNPEVDEKMPPLHVVFGAYEGEIGAKPGEMVVFVGDCASYEGRIGRERTRVRSVYADRLSKHPLHARHEDIFRKMRRMRGSMRLLREDRRVRIGGCPVSVAEQVLLLAAVAGVSNPYLHPKRSLRFAGSYLSWRTRTALARLRGEPYHKGSLLARGVAKTVAPVR